MGLLSGAQTFQTFGVPGGTQPFPFPQTFGGFGGGGGQIVLQASGPITDANPFGGIFADPTACGALQLAGFTCDARGLADAVAAGIAIIKGGGPGKGGGKGGCPPNLVYNEALDECIVPKGSAVVPRAGMGLFGIPAVDPIIVGARTDRFGNVNPIRACPGHSVLGKDDMCYAKGSITNSQRKWPKATRPPVTAGDAKAIRRAEAAKGRVKKLAQNVGFTCKKR